MFRAPCGRTRALGVASCLSVSAQNQKRHPILRWLSVGGRIIECEQIKLELLSPPRFTNRRELTRLAGLKGEALETFSTADVALRYWALPLVAMITDAAGLPVWAPIIYLARSAIRGRGATGLCRFEVANLLISLLPSPEQLGKNKDGLSTLTITRKGGSGISVYVPNSLIEETYWFILTDRNRPKPRYEDVVFIDRTGEPLSRQGLSREFRRCANLIGAMRHCTT